jgi:hypothetical protein
MSRAHRWLDVTRSIWGLLLSEGLLTPMIWIGWDLDVMTPDLDEIGMLGGQNPNLIPNSSGNEGYISSRVS